MLSMLVRDLCEFVDEIELDTLAYFDELSQ